MLSTRDRRAFLQTLWSPFLPASRWEFDVERPLGTAQVYLDVSGSMNAEMPLVIGLLNRLRRFIRMPFWAFSTEVAPARIERGALRTRTTGGTSLACVLEPVARTRPESAVIVTDGFIETIARNLVAQPRPPASTPSSPATAPPKSCRRRASPTLNFPRCRREMVLPGHPDKFCDQVADAIVARCAAADAEAYCQVEVGVWCDQVWISGGYSVGAAVIPPLEEIVASVVRKVGYRDHRTGEVQRFRVVDHVCREATDPRTWTRKVNDQSICVGWAGYDLLTRFHAPEHFLAHTFREALWAAIQGGALQGQGPDGKLLVTMAEEGAVWRLEQVLVTLQQSHDIDFLAFTQRVEQVLRDAYEAVRRRDPRWGARWDEATFTLNPNGPLLDAGPFGDNGQTGRKLAMDFYGPRIGMGGGALSGKHLTHIDRIGSYGAREAAVRAVRSGARECRVLIAYAPNCPEPLEVAFEMEGPGRPLARDFFNHEALCRRYREVRITPELAEGQHFWDMPATSFDKTSYACYI